jgi:WXXGXW repeat (2 copies)
MGPDSMGSRSRRLRRLARSLAAMGLLFAVGAAARQAAADEQVVVRVAPPAPRVEVVPRAPSPHHVWAPGYWGWRHPVGHVWYGGHWIVAQPGYAWEPAHWSERGGYWHFVEGHWRRR